MSWLMNIKIIQFYERSGIVQSIDCFDEVVPQTNGDKFLAWKNHSFEAMFLDKIGMGGVLLLKYKMNLKKVGDDVVYFLYTKGTSSTILIEKLCYK